MKQLTGHESRTQVTLYENTLCQMERTNMYYDCTVNIDTLPTKENLFCITSRLQVSQSYNL